MEKSWRSMTACSWRGKLIQEEYYPNSGIFKESGKCFVVQAPDQNAKTLLECIKDNIPPGTVIYEDYWRSYQENELEAAGYKHFTVNHKYHFVNPNDGTHTQTIERSWGSAKWRNKRHRGTKRDYLDSYLAEFMTRQLMKDEDPFESIMQMISCIYPPVK